MLRVDFRALTQPVGILRILATVTTCICFALAAAAITTAPAPPPATPAPTVTPRTTATPPSPDEDSTYWAWCMFTWCFCFVVTLLILVLEFTTVNAKLPFAWEDFTTAFAMLASLLCLCASIIYPSFFVDHDDAKAIVATLMSWLCFGLYVAEVVFTRLRPRGEIIGFLSTVPGILKMLETFLACLIFISLLPAQYSGSSALQWCVAVYSLCFIFSMAIMLLALGPLTSLLPFPFEKAVIVYNILATVMYATAMVLWPLYAFSEKDLKTCKDECEQKMVMIAVMSVFNFLVYTADSAYSIYLVFFQTID
ncbi:unnamed protein product [Ophioblennius macclurei]